MPSRQINEFSQKGNRKKLNWWPDLGYTRLFENMVLKDKNVDVRLKMDYFALKDKLPKHKLLVFTGPIDAYFASKGMKKLEYRSIYFEVRNFLRVLKVNFFRGLS